MKETRYEGKQTITKLSELAKKGMGIARRQFTTLKKEMNKNLK